MAAGLKTTTTPGRLARPGTSSRVRSRPSWHAGLWWFLLPAAIAMAAVIALPIGYVVYLGFYDFSIMRMTNRFVGFDNYLKILGDAEFLLAIGRTVIYVVVVILADFVYGFLVALLAWRLPLGWSKLFRALVILPMILIPSAAAMLWRGVIYTPPYAVFNDLFGLSSSFSMLASADTSLMGIILASIWGWSPWVFLLLLAGLEGLPKEPLEAAEVEGVTFPQLVRYIVLPMMKPVIFITLSLKAIDSFLSFTYPWIMTEGGPGGSSHILSTYIFERAFKFLDYGYGAALGVVMMLIAIVGATLVIRAASKRGYLDDTTS